MRLTLLAATFAIDHDVKRRVIDGLFLYALVRALLDDGKHVPSTCTRPEACADAALIHGFSPGSLPDNVAHRDDSSGLRSLMLGPVSQGSSWCLSGRRRSSGVGCALMHQEGSVAAGLSAVRCKPEWRGDRN